jgi:UDP-2,3-diacylglucosamine hydrolase
VTFLAVSDLHIWGADDPLYRSLLALLRDRAKAGDTLVLAGDLFDLFVGSKRTFLERYREFLDEVANACARGVQIHYIEGNHDFLMKRAFRHIPKGFAIHAQEVALELAGRRFFVAHGDLVDRRDYGYRALRLFFRSPFIRAFVAVAPSSWIDRIGQASSHASREAKTTLLPAQMPQEKLGALRKLYRNFAAERLAEAFDFVVLGHCHDLDEKEFVIDARRGQYINIGYPRTHGSFLSWSAGEEKIQREKMPG